MYRNRKGRQESARIQKVQFTRIDPLIQYQLLPNKIRTNDYTDLSYCPVLSVSSTFSGEGGDSSALRLNVPLRSEMSNDTDHDLKCNSVVLVFIQIWYESILGLSVRSNWEAIASANSEMPWPLWWGICTAGQEVQILSNGTLHKEHHKTNTEPWPHYRQSRQT